LAPTTTTTTLAPTTTTTTLDCGLDGCYEIVNLTTTTTTPAPTTTTTTEAPIVQCLDGLVIETLYIHTYGDLSRLPQTYAHPCSATIGVHTCNRAYFEIFGNGIYMGSSRLNNGDGVGGGLSTESGYYTCQDYNNTPAPLGGTGWDLLSRYDKTTLTKAQAEAIAAAGDGGTTINISYLYKGQSYGGDCAAPHDDVNWLRMTASNGDLIWNSCVIGNSITSFDVCNYTPLCLPSTRTYIFDGFTSYSAGTTSATINATTNDGTYTGEPCCVAFHIMASGDETVTAPAGWTTIVSKRTLLVKQVIMYKYYSSLPSSENVTIGFSGNVIKSVVRSIVKNTSTLTWVDGGEFAYSAQCPSNPFTPATCGEYIYITMKQSSTTPDPEEGANWWYINRGTTTDNGGWSFLAQSTESDHLASTIPSTNTIYPEAGSFWSVYRIH
jgi:hypothetical protein